MNAHFLKYLTNKWVLSAVLFILLIPLLPSITAKYKIEITGTGNISPESSVIYYEDLDNDGNSERIMSSTNMWGNSSFIIHNSRGELINQWNMDSPRLNFMGRLFFYDLNGNDQKEIILFTRAEDSIRCHINALNDSINPIELSFNVDRIGNFDSSMDYSKTNDVSVTAVIPKIIDGKTKLFFSIASGFSGYPRNIYRYSLEKGELKRSEHLGNRPGIVNISDIDQDGRLELILSANSASNNRWFDSLYYKRSDESSWQMILDEELHFKFPPKEIKSEFSGINQDTIVSKEGISVITASFIKRDEDGSSKLFKTSGKGKLLDSVDLEANSGMILNNPRSKQIVIYSNLEGLIQSFDYNLKLLKSTSVPKNMVIVGRDIDFDGLNEWIAVDYNKGYIRIFENNLEKTAELFIPEILRNPPRSVGLKLKDGKPFLWFQLKDQEYELYYSYNTRYLLNWVLYPFTYLLLVALIWGVLKLQELKAQRDQELEHQISELQLKAIKNQMDPHFVFNSINTIAEMKLTDKLEVDQFICEFSDLMRKTISNNDSILHSLRDELDYVKNYIRLQKLRLDDSFSSEIEIVNAACLDEIVPKHTIYSYVENAIKHGFGPEVKEGGRLIIHIDCNPDGLNIGVMNNIVSDVIDQEVSKRSTGNGMKIMTEIFDLFSNRYNRKIDVQYDQYSIDGNDFFRVNLYFERKKQ